MLGFVCHFFLLTMPSHLWWGGRLEKRTRLCLHVNKFNGLFSLIAKGQGRVREERRAFCKSLLVWGLLEERVTSDREHCMPETAFQQLLCVKQMQLHLKLLLLAITDLKIVIALGGFVSPFLFFVLTHVPVKMSLEHKKKKNPLLLSDLVTLLFSVLNLCMLIEKSNLSE